MPEADTVVSCGQGNIIIHFPPMEKVIDFGLCGNYDRGFEGSMKPDGSIEAELQIIIASTIANGYNHLTARVLGRGAIMSKNKIVHYINNFAGAGGEEAAGEARIHEGAIGPALHLRRNLAMDMRSPPRSSVETTILASIWKRRRKRSLT